MNLKPRIMAAGLLTTVFLTGAIVGGVSSTAWGGNDDRQRSEGNRKPFAEKLAVELELTAEQRTTLDSVLERRREDMCSIWKELHPRYRSVRDSVRADIANMLQPNQMDKFEAFKVRGDSMWANRKGRGRDC